MAYFNGYPATYPQYYPQFQQNQPVSVQNNAQNTQNGIIWVQGEAGAKSYLVAPNNTVQLWDSESQTIYLKSADASGMPSMKILDYTIRDLAKNPANSLSNPSMGNLSDFATKSEIAAISAEIDALQRKVNRLTSEKEAEHE